MKTEQLEKKVKELDQKDPLSDVKKKFASVKDAKIDRKVTLVIEWCGECGCCADFNIERTVSHDSPLQNGDRVTKLQKGDKEI